MHCVRFGLAVVLCTSPLLVFEMELSSRRLRVVGRPSRASSLQIDPSAASRRWVRPVTSFGDPDLQGVWMNNRATPLERPKALEGRPS